MREILFRGKRKDNGEWVEGYYAMVNPVDMPARIRKPKAVIFPVDARCNWFNKYFYNVVEVIPETIGEYTEINDKNDKKIFEGDIIRYGDDEEHFVVEDRSGSFHIIDYVIGCRSVLWQSHEWVILGNIYDNPELLDWRN